MEQSLVTELGRQSDTSLMPAWMTSQQPTGGTLGYTPAWVICYTKPGASAIVKSNIDQLWPYTMNLVNFELDRVLVDKSLTFNYVPSTKKWKSLPSGVLQPVTIGARFEAPPTDPPIIPAPPPPPIIGTIAPNKVVLSFDSATFAEYWYVDMAFTLSSNTGVAIGGLDVNTVYYVRSIDTASLPIQITVSKSLDGATEILTTSTLSEIPPHIITATPLHPGPQPIDSKDYMVLYDHTTIVY